MRRRVQDESDSPEPTPEKTRRTNNQPNRSSLKKAIAKKTVRAALTKLAEEEQGASPRVRNALTVVKQTTSEVPHTAKAKTNPRQDESNNNHLKAQIPIALNQSQARHLMKATTKQEAKSDD